MPAASAKKWLIQDAVIEINTGTEAVPVWTEVEGINNVTLDPSVSDTDLTDFNSGGFTERVPVRRDWAMAVSGFHMEDPADGARATGQAAVQAENSKLGTDAIKSYQMTVPSGAGFKGPGYVNVTGPSGGTDDGAAWGFTITSAGELTPVAPAP